MCCIQYYSIRWDIYFLFLCVYIIDARKRLVNEREGLVIEIEWASEEKQANVWVWLE